MGCYSTNHTKYFVKNNGYLKILKIYQNKDDFKLTIKYLVIFMEWIIIGLVHILVYSSYTTY